MSFSFVHASLRSFNPCFTLGSNTARSTTLASLLSTNISLSLSSINSNGSHLNGNSGASPINLQFFPVRFMLSSRNNNEKKKKKTRFIQNRAINGLFDGKHITSGHSISHSHQKTVRYFKPNVHKANIYSNILERSFRINVTSAALRTLDKAGGLDNYLLHKTSSKLGPDHGFAKQTRKLIIDKIKEDAIARGEDPIIAYKRRKYPHAPVIFEEKKRLDAQEKKQQQQQSLL